MDEDALQALYEEIGTYQDSIIKKDLFEQLKQERPDFKLKIDVKKFLQHVAYGEQDAAEKLLQKDPELIQSLLRVNNIPFTDYSGRTFTCTAYEYAYWAKDTHMQRMLEKYILQDEETRQFILEKVTAIDNPTPSPTTPDFFQSSSKPQGLRYTTKDKQGNIIEHFEAHFDLTPLINALQHYIRAYHESPQETEADWAVPDKIWVEEVGRAQRDVPAHIAQEYCHPDRSFYDIRHDLSLLDASIPFKRRLQFFNLDTGNIDLWFTPDSYSIDSGLGFSYGVCGDVVVSGRQCACARGGMGRNDLVALTVIDEMRTRDLKQSLHNLSQPALRLGL